MFFYRLGVFDVGVEFSILVFVWGLVIGGVVVVVVVMIILFLFGFGVGLMMVLLWLGDSVFFIIVGVMVVIWFVVV